jgi:hypothetical protein
LWGGRSKQKDPHHLPHSLIIFFADPHWPQDIDDDAEISVAEFIACWTIGSGHGSVDFI